MTDFLLTKEAEDLAEQLAKSREALAQCLEALEAWRSLPKDPNWGKPLGFHLLGLYERDADRAIVAGRAVLP